MNLKTHLTQILQQVEGQATPEERNAAFRSLLLKTLRQPEASSATLLVPVETTVSTPVKKSTPKTFANQAEDTPDVPTQVAYNPLSKAPQIGTLVPFAMATATENALRRLNTSVGDVDAFVAEKLNYESIDLLWTHFAAEQIDAIALAIVNIERGKGFIIGDQTGIGKGRFNAGIERYAMEQGHVPISLTRSPDLYVDKIRDLIDVGVNDFTPMLTNTSMRALPLPDGRVLKNSSGSHKILVQKMVETGQLLGFHGIWSTYSQMQTVKNIEPYRRELMRRFAPKSVLILDESHEAGGAPRSSWKDKNAPPDRAEFVRELIDSAIGTVYSSATYAKNPSVMSLYRSTDMQLAVTEIERLAPLLEKGGIPLQQAVASMLVESGQYLRRERSFADVNFFTDVVTVDPGQIEAFAYALRSILEFDDYKETAAKEIDKDLKSQAKALKVDLATGKIGAESLSFASILHNIVGQFLLAISADAVVEKCLEILGRNEKPVVALSNTMGSFIEAMVERDGLQVGDLVNLGFDDLLDRYLERSRVLLVQDVGGKTNHYRLTDEDLGKKGAEVFRSTKKILADMDFSSIPVSPIDWVTFRLRQEGHSIGEITGRHHCIDYIKSAQGYYKRRSSVEADKTSAVKTRNSFNSGSLDVIILNRSGSTGISLHSSPKFLDDRKRVMILAQADPDINVFMQMMGRVHRTGQKVAPDYCLMMIDAPISRRPGAVLARKLASLNANVVAARKTDAVSLSGVADIINEIGDRAVTVVMDENAEAHVMMGEPLEDLTATDEGAAVRRVTGRIPLLPLAEQERIYNLIEAEYQQILEEEQEAGRSPLEAATCDFQALTVERTKLIEGSCEEISPFLSPVWLETMDVRSLARPLRRLDVYNAIHRNLEREEISAVRHYDSAIVEEIAKKRAADLVEEVRQQALLYRKNTLESANYLPAPDDAPASVQQMRQGKRDRFDAALMSQFSSVKQFVEKFPLGTTVRIKHFSGDIRYGVVVRVTRNASATNPVALGSWRLVVSLAGTGITNQAVIPFKWLLAATEEGTAYFQVTPSAKTLMDESIWEYFDLFTNDARAQVKMLTGNLLRAYDKFSQYGSLINFTMASGQVRQGLLLQDSLEEEKLWARDYVCIPSLEKVRACLKLIPLQTLDQLLTVSFSEENFRPQLILTTSKSRQIGGKYFLDAKLLELAKTQFYSKADKMQMIIEGANLIDAMLTFLGGDRKQLGVFDQRHQKLLPGLGIS